MRYPPGATGSQMHPSYIPPPQIYPNVASSAGAGFEPSSSNFDYSQSIGSHAPYGSSATGYPPNVPGISQFPQASNPTSSVPDMPAP